jgi:tRNA G18 (ribose-2'-O)-methylase SpoU
MALWNSILARKLLNLSPEHQEKMLAKAVRDEGDYLRLCHAMGRTPLPVETFEERSNAFHDHLQAAELSVKEHNLLVRTCDREEADPYLPIDIYLDHIRSAHNVGSIFRTVEAMRLGTIYLSDQTPTPEHKQVRDAGMGACEWVPWQRGMSQRRPIIALETVEGATPLAKFDFPETFTLVVGNEEYGVSEEVLERADHVIEIPLFGRKNSLNVANAFAIIAAEIRRQKELALEGEEKVAIWVSDVDSKKGAW